MLLQIIGQICAFDRRRIPLYNAPIQGKPLNLQLQKFGLKKLETLLYHMAQNVFRCLEPLDMADKCDKQTDRKKPLLAIVRPNMCTKNCISPLNYAITAACKLI